LGPAIGAAAAHLQHRGHLRGETLHARIRQEGRLRLAFALEVALLVAEALHYMHEHSVIHCDIKSENVFLCRHQGEGRKRPVVKLIDFGLSRTEALQRSGKITPRRLAGGARPSAASLGVAIFLILLLLAPCIRPRRSADFLLNVLQYASDKIHFAPCRERFLLVLATKKRAKLESDSPFGAPGKAWRTERRA